MRGTYLDSNIVIALVESAQERRARTVTQLPSVGDLEPALVVSDLVRLECRVKPLANGAAAVLAAYDSFFGSPKVHVVSLTAAVCDRATQIRARYRYETADALHLAAAIEAGCDGFLTADAQLAGFGEIPVLLVKLD